MTRLLGSMMLLATMTAMTGCDEYKLLRNVAGVDFGYSGLSSGYSYYEPAVYEYEYEYEEIVVEETYYDSYYEDSYYGHDDYYYDNYLSGYWY